MTHSNPTLMNAIEIMHPGPCAQLEVIKRPIPSPKSKELLIRVSAAGVNRPDLLQCLGLYPPPAGASDIPGLEIAGEVVQVGKDVNNFFVGDHVCALVAGGGYAEYCCVDESNALPKPKNLSMVEAAALPETFFTVWSNLFQRAQLKAGETVLIHGGTSGIGSTAIMLAKAFDAYVITTVGSEEKQLACQALGADIVINYQKEDFVERTLQITCGKGADVIVDIIGGDYLAKNYQVAALEGRIVQIGIQHGKVNGLNLMPLMQKRLTHTGSTLRTRDITEKAAIAKELYQCVWPLLEQEVIKPLIDATYPLHEAAAAHAHMKSNKHIGKIVLLISYYLP